MCLYKAPKCVTKSPKKIIEKRTHTHFSIDLVCLVAVMVNVMFHVSGDRLRAGSAPLLRSKDNSKTVAFQARWIAHRRRCHEKSVHMTAMQQKMQAKVERVLRWKVWQTCVNEVAVTINRNVDICAKSVVLRMFVLLVSWSACGVFCHIGAYLTLTFMILD